MSRKKSRARALAALGTFAGVRRALLGKLGPWLLDGGFIPVGCDGSRLRGPRGAGLERRLGTRNKDGIPQVGLTAMARLGTGLLWSWRLGQAGREGRPNRQSSKVKRRWPVRGDHKPPKPPNLRTPSDQIIAKLHKVLASSEDAHRWRH